MTEHDRRLLQQCLNWIRSFKITGPFVTGRSSLQSGASYHVGARGRETSTNFRPPLVKITGSASGGGKYTGTLWTRPTANIPATGDLTEAELGIAGDTVRIVNTREVGQSTHDLASSGFLPLVVPATFLKTADDGVPVYMVDVFQHKDCTA